MNKIQLAIVDDHEMARKAVIRLLNLENDWEVVLEAENGIDLLRKLNESNPDIILMDIQMPKMNGIEATERVLSRYPNIKIIAVTQFDNEQNIIEMYSRGVKSFLGKGCNPAELFKAIRVVYTGGIYITDEIFKNTLQHYLKEPILTESHENPENLKKLSKAELIILWHTSCCKSIKQIANELCISPNTVNNHQATIRKKLGLNGRNSILQYSLALKTRIKEIASDNFEME